MTASRFVYSFAAVLSTALLASCGGQSSAPQLPASPGTLNQLSKPAAISPAHGGAFSANASGGYTLVCRMESFGDFSFSGNGKASFLHGMQESGKMSNGFDCNGKWSGAATLIAERNRNNTVSVNLVGSCRVHCLSPCQSAVTFTVTGGTGRFAHATGSGTVQFTCTNPYGNGTYTDAWSGTLNF